MSNPFEIYHCGAPNTVPMTGQAKHFSLCEPPWPFEPRTFSDCKQQLEKSGFCSLSDEAENLQKHKLNDRTRPQPKRGLVGWCNLQGAIFPNRPGEGHGSSSWHALNLEPYGRLHSCSNSVLSEGCSLNKSCDTELALLCLLKPLLRFMRAFYTTFDMKILGSVGGPSGRQGWSLLWEQVIAQLGGNPWPQV